MSTESRHQAEKLQALLSDLESTERALREALDAKTGDYAPLLTRSLELNAHVRVRAETLARAVLAEAAPHVCANCEGTDPASYWNNGSVL